MPNSDLLPSLLFKINENQLALEAAILELSNWVEARGPDDAGVIRSTLQSSLPATTTTAPTGSRRGYPQYVTQHN